MGKDSSIQWTDHTWSPWRGCTRISPGCHGCYAEAGSKRNPAVLGKWGSEGAGGTRVVAAEAGWRAVLKWDREAAKAGERRRVFCASLADVFEDWQGPMVDSRGRTSFVEDGEWVGYSEPLGSGARVRRLTMDDVRARLALTILDTPNLDYLLLTKRIENAGRMLAEMFGGPAPFNVWLGVTAENQEWADKRIPLLLQTPAAVRFVSYEPALEAVDFRPWLYRRCRCGKAAVAGSAGPCLWCGMNDWLPPLDQIICGGESGPRARPFDLAWARSARDQCKAAGVAYFFKQAGSRPYEMAQDPAYVSKHEKVWPVKFRDGHGGNESEFPSDLRGCRAFPAVGQGVAS